MGRGTRFAATARAGVLKALVARICCILLDVGWPGIDGLETLKQFARCGFGCRGRDFPVHGNIDAGPSYEAGRFDFIEKPLSIREEPCSPCATPCASNGWN